LILLDKPSLTPLTTFSLGSSFGPRFDLSLHPHSLTLFQEYSPTQLSKTVINFQVQDTPQPPSTTSHLDLLVQQGGDSEVSSWLALAGGAAIVVSSYDWVAKGSSLRVLGAAEAWEVVRVSGRVRDMARY
jgi:hypothetical protein